MLIRVTKLEAARRQLITGIELLFNGADPVSAHTLVGAASVVLADLAQHRFPGENWDSWAQKENSLEANEYWRVLRTTQNFLKHARTDVDETHEFNPIDTDALAFCAVRNASLFGELSLEESTLELWYIACNDPSTIGHDDELFRTAARYFGDLRSVDRATQLVRAREVLTAARSTPAPTEGETGRAP